jgi:DNA sulfur modification protein DndD
MLLKRLVLHNFGTYAGSQELNLQTAPEKTVILIGGKNGAGKSTLLEAIRLCLHGQMSDRLLTTRERYERYLLAKMHRGSPNDLPVKSSFIEVEFDYGDQDGVRNYKARRSWQRKPSGGITETFQLSADDSPVSDVDAGHWQEFIQELIPMGVSDLFFFDGEKVQLLAEDESDRLTLAEAVKNLLGTDIIERLHADVSIYRSRAVQSVAEEANAPDIDVLNATVDLMRDRLTQTVAAANEASNRMEALRIDVMDLEQRIQEKGGSYAKNRGKLEERKQLLSARVAALEALIREKAHALLPVTFAPKLLKATVAQLALEQDLRFQCVLEDALGKAARATLTRLKKLTLKRGAANIPLGDLPEFEKILSVIKSTHKTQEWDAPMIHDLSNADEQQIRSWATEALDTLPKELKRTSEELETLYREQQNVERDLAQIPPEETLHPLLDELRALHKRLADCANEAIQKNTEVEQAQQAIANAEGNYRRAVDTLAATSLHRESLQKAARVQQVLTEFKSAMIERKLKQVEIELTNCFNQLSRKRLRRVITINPHSFQVTIKDEHDRAISKQELSAGEKQIYAISILWALGKVSGRPLPIIIDTPLARLDRDHRALLGRRYFPYASHQVIVLSTDTEIDNDFIPLLGDSVARTYELSFDSASQSTKVTEGYFARNSSYETQ